MWVWQSQAPAGTSKFTAVDGCAALANALLVFMATPAATEASRIPRRVSMVSSLMFWEAVYPGTARAGRAAHTRAGRTKGAAEAGDAELDAPSSHGDAPHVIPRFEQCVQTSNQPRPQPPPMRTTSFSCFAYPAATTKQRAFKLASRLLRVRHIWMNEAARFAQLELVQCREQGGVERVGVLDLRDMTEVRQCDERCPRPTGAADRAPVPSA